MRRLGNAMLGVLARLSSWLAGRSNGDDWIAVVRRCLFLSYTP